MRYVDQIITADIEDLIFTSRTLVHRSPEVISLHLAMPELLEAFLAAHESRSQDLMDCIPPPWLEFWLLDDD